MARSHGKIQPGERFTRRRYQPWPDISEVPAFTYLLMDGEEVVYVGSTTNIRDRLTAHRKPKVWDSVELIAAESPRAAFDLEGDLIFQYRPRFNVQLTHHGRGRAAHS